MWHVYLYLLHYNWFTTTNRKHLKFFFRIPFPSNPPVVEPVWFGTGERPKLEDVAIKPFKIEVKDSVLNDLKSRLKLDLDRLKNQHQVFQVLFLVSIVHRYLTEGDTASAT